jgi:transposase
MRRHELTDEEGRKRSPLLPRYGRSALQGDRNVINAVL